MTRNAAFRASALFLVFALFFGAVGLSSHVAAAQALCLVSLSVLALTSAFALVAPAHAPVPLRARRRR